MNLHGRLDFSFEETLHPTVFSWHGTYALRTEKGKYSYSDAHFSFSVTKHGEKMVGTFALKTFISAEITLKQ
jgi:hypothetical protein